MEVIGSDDFIKQGDWSAEKIWSEGWKVRKKNEFVGMLDYLKKNLGKPVILDVGGSHGVWDGQMLETILGMLRNYPNKFLILPSEDESTNTEFLRGRLLGRELSSLPQNIRYWEAILNGDMEFAKSLDDTARKEFLERVELVRKEDKFKTMAMNMIKSNQTRLDALQRGPEWMEYDNSPDKPFDFEMNKIEDYSKFFIDTMKASGIANHIIYNKGKSPEALVQEILDKIV